VFVWTCLTLALQPFVVKVSDLCIVSSDMVIDPYVVPVVSWFVRHGCSSAYVAVAAVDKWPSKRAEASCGERSLC